MTQRVTVELNSVVPYFNPSLLEKHRKSMSFGAQSRPWILCVSLTACAPLGKICDLRSFLRKLWGIAHIPWLLRDFSELVYCAWPIAGGWCILLSTQPLLPSPQQQVKILITTSGSHRLKQNERHFSHDTVTFFLSICVLAIQRTGLELQELKICSVYKIYFCNCDDLFENFIGSGLQTWDILD